MRWNFKTALTLNFVLLSSLPILIIGFFAMTYLTSSMKEEISNKNMMLANSYARELDQFLGNALHRMAYLIHIMEDHPFLQENQINEHLAWQISNDKDWEMVKVLNNKNIVTHLAPLEKNILGLDMSRQEYCQEAIKRKAPYWSNVFISPQTGASTLVLAIPFKQGMVVGHLSLLAVHKLINSITMSPGGYVAVVDRYGTTIAHHNQILVTQRLNLSNLAHIAQGLTGHTGTFRYIMEEKDHIGSVASVPETHWVVAVSQPLHEIFLPINKLKQILYAGTFFTIFIAILAALFSLNRMLSPLKKLTQDVQTIAVGNYAVEPLVNSYSEITELSEGFHIMIRKVEAREISLRENEHRFRATFEQAAVGIAHVTAEGRFFRINQKYCDILGYSHQEMLQRSFKDITYPEDLDNDLAHLKQLLEGKNKTYAVEKRYVLKNGKILWVGVTVSLVHNELKKEQWLVCVVQDINVRKQTESKLHEYQQRLKSLVSQLTVAEERERRRIAADLHDHVGQLLAFSRMQVSAMQKASSETQKQELSNEISKTLLEAIQKTKQVIFDLSPPVMNEIGLTDAVSDWLQEQMESRHKITTDLLVKGGKERLDDDLKAILFRNIRELLVNVVKHAEASHVDVQFEFTDTHLNILVTDDGKGFNVNAISEKAKQEKGFGLFSIEERMSDLGGSFKIKSEAGQGSKALLTVPLG